MKQGVWCVWCDGTAVDEEGCVCLACAGTCKVSWSFVVSMDAAWRYPASVQLEQGTLKVREAITAICDHHESLWGRCTACGMTWAQQAEAAR